MYAQLSFQRLLNATIIVITIMMRAKNNAQSHYVVMTSTGNRFLDYLTEATISIYIRILGLSFFLLEVANLSGQKPCLSRGYICCFFFSKNWFPRKNL